MFCFVGTFFCSPLAWLNLFICLWSGGNPACYKHGICHPRLKGDDMDLAGKQADTSAKECPAKPIVSTIYCFWLAFACYIGPIRELISSPQSRSAHCLICQSVLPLPACWRQVQMHFFVFCFLVSGIEPTHIILVTVFLFVVRWLGCWKSKMLSCRLTLRWKRNLLTLLRLL